MALDLNALWDFGNAALSEQRFQAQLAGASADDTLILQTQIARTYGLRRDFARAQEILTAVQPRLLHASAEAQTRHALEWGRTLASAKHTPAQQTAEQLTQARGAYNRALVIAQTHQLDALAIDTLHMLAFVDTAPVDQLKWGGQALAISLASDQPAAKKWEASLRNNIGMALHAMERFDDALTEFQKALVLRQSGSNAEGTRTAHWMVAWTLRALGRTDEALAQQLWLEKQCEAANAPDAYVFEELALLYQLKSDPVMAEHYTQLHKAHAAQ